MAKKRTDSKASARKTTNHTRGARATKETALVRRPPDVPQRTQAELRRFADTVVDTANRAVAKAGEAHDALADYLFEQLHFKVVEAALDPDRHLTPEYVEVRERAGSSLDLSRNELSEHLRIGALNQVSNDDAWDQMKWMKKVALLPLLRLDDDQKTFREGVAVAGRPNMSVRRLREWVQSKTPESTGRPRGMSLAGGRGLVASGVRLGDDEQRQRLAAAVRTKATPAERRRFVKDLEETIANLAKLRREIDAE